MIKKILIGFVLAVILFLTYRENKTIIINNKGKDTHTAKVTNRVQTVKVDKNNDIISSYSKESSSITVTDTMPNEDTLTITDTSIKSSREDSGKYIPFENNSISLGNVGSVGGDIDLSRKDDHSFKDGSYRASSSVATSMEGLSAEDVDTIVNRARIDLSTKIKTDMKLSKKLIDKNIVSLDTNIHDYITLKNKEGDKESKDFTTKNLKLQEDALSKSIENESNILNKTISTQTKVLSKSIKETKDIASKELEVQTKLLNASIDETANTSLNNNKYLKEYVKASDKDIKSKIAATDKQLEDTVSSLSEAKTNLLSSIETVVRTVENVSYKLSSIENNLSSSISNLNSKLERETNDLEKQIESNKESIQAELALAKSNIETLLGEALANVNSLVSREELDVRLEEVNSTIVSKTKRTLEVFWYYGNVCPLNSVPLNGTGLDYNSPLYNAFEDGTTPDLSGRFIRNKTESTSVGRLQPFSTSSEGLYLDNELSTNLTGTSDTIGTGEEVETPWFQLGFKEPDFGYFTNINKIVHISSSAEETRPMNITMNLCIHE